MSAADKGGATWQELLRRARDYVRDSYRPETQYDAERFDTLKAAVDALDSLAAHAATTDDEPPKCLTCHKPCRLLWGCLDCDAPPMAPAAGGDWAEAAARELDDLAAVMRADPCVDTDEAMACGYANSAEMVRRHAKDAAGPAAPNALVLPDLPLPPLPCAGCEQRVAKLAGIEATLVELDTRARSLRPCHGPNCGGCELGRAVALLRAALAADTTGKEAAGRGVGEKLNG